MTPKKRLIFGFLILFSTVLMAACASKEADEVSEVYVPEVSTIIMKPGLEQTFSVTGEVFAEQFSRLTAEQRATVVSISVNEGDTVTKGQELIRLSSIGVDSALNTASTSFQNAQRTVSETKQSTVKNIEAARLALETTQITLQNTLNQNHALEIQAEEALNAAKLGVDLGVAAAETSLENAIQNSLPAAQSALNASDKILGVSYVYKFSNDSFENNLGAMNSKSKSDAEQALRDAQAMLSDYSASYDNALLLLLASEYSLQKTATVLSFSMVGSNYTQATLSADQAAINLQLVGIRAKISALQAAQDALNTTHQETNGKSQAVINAEAAYSATLTQLESAEASARKAVESAQKALENAQQSATLSNLTAKSALDTVYGSYDQARISRNKLTIQAPFTGKVTAIHVKTGEEVNPGSLLITVEDDSILNVVAYLSAQDVLHVRRGDAVIINQTEESQISSIAPSADPLTKKYKVEVDHRSDSLKPGQFVKLTFSSGEVFDGNRLFIPLPSLHILPNELFVWTIEGRKTTKVTVEIGEIVGDYVEVISGLTEGDEVISDGGRLLEEEGIKVNILNRPTPKVPDNQ